jgi:hypothetical protein
MGSGCIVKRNNAHLGALFQQHLDQGDAYHTRAAGDQNFSIPPHAVHPYIEVTGHQ